MENENRLMELCPAAQKEAERNDEQSIGADPRPEIP